MCRCYAQSGRRLVSIKMKMKMKQRRKISYNTNWSQQERDMTYQELTLVPIKMLSQTRIPFNRAEQGETALYPILVLHLEKRDMPERFS